MDIILSTLTIIVYCLAIFAIVWVIRKIFEFSFPKLKVATSRLGEFWAELFLPIVPVIIGGLASLIPGYPYPEQFTTTYSHVFFGIFCGLISGLVYRVLKKKFTQKLQEISGKNTE